MRSFARKALTLTWAPDPKHRTFVKMRAPSFQRSATTVLLRFHGSSSSEPPKDDIKSTLRYVDETDMQDSMTFVSQMKNPIVHQLWTARQKAKKAAAGDSTGSNTSCPTRRTPSQSKTDITYPFATDRLLRETYRNPWGQVRFGKLLEDLDALAGNIAFAHVQDPYVTIVTASVDRICLRGIVSDDFFLNDQHLTGQVTYVGTSSMEIRMQCVDDRGRKNENGKEGGGTDDDGVWMEAYFTFVATDPETKRPTRIPPVYPETPREKARWVAGQRRAERRKAARKRGSPFESQTSEVDVLAMDLLQQASPLLQLPSLADPMSILLPATKMQNAEIAQPQVRNMANQIFGGFLMRRAFELGYATCYVFGGGRPRFLEVDEVSFQSPVEVGDLVVFNSCVLYTNLDERQDTETEASNKPASSFLTGLRDGIYRGGPLVTIQVEAWVTTPEHASAKLSNRFCFTYALPLETRSKCRRVLPSTMDEARRMATRMLADNEHEEE